MGSYRISLKKKEKEKKKRHSLQLTCHFRFSYFATKITPKNFPFHFCRLSLAVDLCCKSPVSARWLTCAPRLGQRTCGHPLLLHFTLLCNSLWSSWIELAALTGKSSCSFFFFNVCLKFRSNIVWNPRTNSELWLSFCISLLKLI